MLDASPYTTLRFEVREHVARILLNRPESGNALNREMAYELLHAALRCDDDPTIRAVVLTGAGNAFCVGGDLKSFAAEQERVGHHLKEVLTGLHTAISTFIRMEAPVIAAVNGVAAGGGMSLACACDLVIAAESARFTVAYTRVGLSPDGSSSYVLPRLVGLRRALDLTLTNRMLSAAEALEWGLITRVVSDATLAMEADALAAQLAAGSRGALGAAKRLLHASWNETLETQMAHEAQSIAALAQSPDGREGVAAFVEKRPPKYSGS
jgi:2-(1,2-epoxy-1,2-dihydrophenyl)acetyl-CoA isomerase